MQPLITLRGPGIDAESCKLPEAMRVHVVRQLEGLQRSDTHLVPHAIKCGYELQDADDPRQGRKIQGQQASAHQSDVPRRYLGRGRRGSGRRGRRGKRQCRRIPKRHGRELAGHRREHVARVYGASQVDRQLGHFHPSPCPGTDHQLLPCKRINIALGEQIRGLLGDPLNRRYLSSWLNSGSGDTVAGRAGYFLGWRYSVSRSDGRRRGNIGGSKRGGRRRSRSRRARRSSRGRGERRPRSGGSGGAKRGARSGRRRR